MDNRGHPMIKALGATQKFKSGRDMQGFCWILSSIFVVIPSSSWSRWDTNYIILHLKFVSSSITIQCSWFIIHQSFFIHSFIHSFVRSFIHSFIHSSPHVRNTCLTAMSTSSDYIAIQTYWKHHAWLVHWLGVHPSAQCASNCFSRGAVAGDAECCSWCIRWPFWTCHIHAECLSFYPATDLLYSPFPFWTDWIVQSSSPRWQTWLNILAWGSWVAKTLPPFSTGRPRLWHLPTFLRSIVSSLPWRGGSGCVTKGVKRYAQETRRIYRYLVFESFSQSVICIEKKGLRWVLNHAFSKIMIVQLYMTSSRRCWVFSTATAQRVA